jgi:putative transposase
LEDAVIRSATVTRNGAHWYISILIDDGHATPAEHARPHAAVGVDRGVNVAIAMSDGQLIDSPLLTSGEQQRALRLQRKLDAPRSAAVTAPKLGRPWLTSGPESGSAVRISARRPRISWPLISALW